MVFKSRRQAEAPGALAINSGSAPVTAGTLSATRSRTRRPPTASSPLWTPPYRLAEPPARTAPRILDLEATVFDGEAVVHDERNAGLGGARLRRRVHHPLLQPDQLRPVRNRPVHNGPGLLAASQHIHDVDGVITGRVAQRAVA